MEKYSKSRGIISKVVLGATLLFFYLPIIYIIIFSFNSSKSLTRFDGFSLRWYEKMFADPVMLDSIWYTIIIAVIATAVSTILGTITAIGLSKSGKILRSSVERVNELPVMNPDIVTGISLLMLFSAIAIPKGFITMLLAHIMFCTPFVILSVMPKLRTLDPNMTDAGTIAEDGLSFLENAEDSTSSKWKLTAIPSSGICLTILEKPSRAL